MAASARPGARVYGFTRCQVWQVVLPAALPAISTGVYLALIYSWLATIGAQFLLVSGRGMGNTLVEGSEHFRVDLVLFGMVTIGLVGWGHERFGPRPGAPAGTLVGENFLGTSVISTPQNDLLISGPGKRYASTQARGGELQVLQGIDLHVPEGRFVSIVGASGCGKSTLLRLVLGLMRSTKGASCWAEARSRAPGRSAGSSSRTTDSFPG